MFELPTLQSSEPVPPTPVLNNQRRKTDGRYVPFLACVLFSVSKEASLALISL